MPKLWHHTYHYWGAKEKAQYNTERHQVFKEELYPHASLSRQEFLDKLGKFKEKNFDLLDSEKSVEAETRMESSDNFKGSTRSDSILDNKLEG